MVGDRVLASDGRALIVAMDHPRTHGAIEDPGAVIEASVDGGADGVMTTFGVAKRYREQLAERMPTILRLDGGPSLYRGPGRYSRTCRGCFRRRAAVR